MTLTTLTLTIPANPWTKPISNLNLKTKSKPSNRPWSWENQTKCPHLPKMSSSQFFGTRYVASTRTHMHWWAHTYPAQWHHHPSILLCCGWYQAEVSKTAQSWAAKEKDIHCKCWNGCISDPYSRINQKLTGCSKSGREESGLTFPRRTMGLNSKILYWIFFSLVFIMYCLKRSQDINKGSLH